MTAQQPSPALLAATGALIAGAYARRCRLCEASAGEHDFRRSCCRERFLLALPGTERFRATRAGWLDRWRREYGQAAADETQDAVAAVWERRRDETRLMIAEARAKLGGKA